MSTKPVMSPTLEHEVTAAVIQYKETSKWRDWGLAHYRDQGSCVLLYGPPGTGKTTIAQYLAKKIKLGLREIDIATFGSNSPGTNERQIEEFFACAKRDRKAVFFDEADSILWDRSKAGADAMWMIAVINKMLSEIAKYPFPVFIATNRPHELDSALERRFIAKIHVDVPEYEQRIELWKMKIPAKYPLQPTPVQIQELAGYTLTGSEIETIVIKTAQAAITNRKNNITYEDLLQQCKLRSQAATITYQSHTPSL